MMDPRFVWLVWFLLLVDTVGTVQLTRTANIGQPRPSKSNERAESKSTLYQRPVFGWGSLLEVLQVAKSVQKQQHGGTSELDLSQELSRVIK